VLTLFIDVHRGLPGMGAQPLRGRAGKIRRAGFVLALAALSQRLAGGGVTARHASTHPTNA
jgi:hypothetical protein